jgi:hypothetical protein
MSAERDVPTSSASPLRLPGRVIAEGHRRLGRMSRGWRWTVTVILGLLTAVAVAAITVLAFDMHRAQRTEEAISQTRELARAGAEQLLTYDASTLEQDLARSRALVAPNFAAEFENLVTTLIAPATRQTSLRTLATVERAAVVSAEQDRVEVLVFLRQETTRPDREPATASSRAVITMVRDADRWLWGAPPGLTVVCPDSARESHRRFASTAPLSTRSGVGASNRTVRSGCGSSPPAWWVSRRPWVLDCTTRRSCGSRSRRVWRIRRARCRARAWARVRASVERGANPAHRLTRSPAPASSPGDIHRDLVMGRDGRGCHSGRRGGACDIAGHVAHGVNVINRFARFPVDHPQWTTRAHAGT